MNIEPKSDKSDTNYSRTVCGGVKKQKATALLTLAFVEEDGNFFAPSAGRLLYLQQVCLHFFELDEEDDAEEDESNHHHSQSNDHRCAWFSRSIAIDYRVCMSVIHFKME